MACEAYSSLAQSCAGTCDSPLLATMHNVPSCPFVCSLHPQHEALTDEDFNIFTTPEGMLSSEVVPEGVYVPEVVVSKNVRKARGRMKVGLCGIVGGQMGRSGLGGLC